jgi:hypothetical protein
VIFTGAGGVLSCEGCRHTWCIPADANVTCPDPRCRKQLRAGDLRSGRNCPHCKRDFDNGVPISPAPPALRFPSRLIPGRQEKIRDAFSQAEEAFQEFYDSWSHDSTRTAYAGTGALSQSRQEQITRHLDLLESHQIEVQKYLYHAGQRFARIQREYSWHIREERRQEADRFLAELLGSSYPLYSIGLLVRCQKLFPDAYSWDFLADELEERTIAAAAANFARTSAAQLAEGVRLRNLPELQPAANAAAMPAPATAPHIAGSDLPSDGIHDPNAGPSASIYAPSDAVPLPELALDDEIGAAPSRMDWLRSVMAEVPQHVKIAFGVAAALVLSGTLYLHPAGVPNGGDRIQNAVQKTLAQWTNTMQDGDLPGFAGCYATSAAPYYLRKTATRSEISADQTKILRIYPAIRKYTVTNLSYESVTPSRVVLSFDKEWELIGRHTYAGKNRERLELQPSQGQWQITAESELKVYWTLKNGKLTYDQ